MEDILNNFKNEHQGMVKTYLETHYRYEKKIELPEDNSTCAISTVVLMGLFEKNPDLELCNKTHKGYKESTLSIDLSNLGIRGVDYPSVGIEDFLNYEITKFVTDELILEINKSKNKSIGYGNKPLIKSIQTVTEKSNQKIVIKLNYSLK
jgi:hypothetical protein